MTSPPATSKTAGPLARRLDARWRRRVDYPVLGQHYRTSGDIDLMRSMRMLFRFTSVIALAFIAMFIAAIVGVDLPENLHLLLIIPAVAIMAASTPNATSVLLWQVRPRWAQRWLDAGVQLTDLRLLTRSPLTPARVRAYTRALGPTPEFGVDVRLVWALHERGITPQRLNTYITTLADNALLHGPETGNTTSGASREDLLVRHAWHPTTGAPKALRVVPTVEDVLHISDHYTPEEWATLRAANPLPTNRRLLDLARWAATSRATLHPSQFTDADTLPERDATTVADTLMDWYQYNDDPSFPERQLRCPDVELPTSGRCATCGTTDASRHRGYTIHPADIMTTAAHHSRRSGVRTTMRAWAHGCGTLAPVFLEVDFDFRTAVNMCAQPTPPTPEMIRTMAALRTDLL